ncbi:MAG: NAD(P)H-binding protein [Burkholderiales bacterium]|nr:NAD(P)H-binding protein [Burkholderiales bacterium]
MTTLPSQQHPPGRRVLVLGANGRLGSAAVQAFASAGWQVTAQARQAPRQPLPASVQALQADALDLPAMTRAAQGVDLIVHALNPDYARWDTLLPPLTDAVIRVAEASGATLMLPGNVYNFGRELPAVLTESTPFVANTPKAAQRIALEAAMAASRARSIVIRAGDFLGGTGTWIDLAIGKGLPDCRITQMGPQDLPHAWAWLPDLAQVFVQVAERVAERPDALPRHAVLHYAGLTLTGAELQAAFEAALHRPLQARAFPWWALRLAAPFSPMMRALSEMRYLWQRPHRLDETRLRALIGPVPHTPLAQVVQRLVTAAWDQNLSSKRKVAVV